MFNNQNFLFAQQTHQPKSPYENTLYHKPIIVNGYCYPNVDLKIVSEALPHLTFLSIFSYQVKPDGSLSTIDDAALIQAAYQNRTAPRMVITNIASGGSFDSQLASTILNSDAITDTLLANVIAVMKEKQYLGLDVDFEYLLPSDLEAYNRFLEKASRVMHENGYTLSTAIAPKTSADQKGVLYEAHDYNAHGRYADYVILMTYEWGHTYGPPRAIAPIDEVRKVLDYAVTEISSEKILMGIPNYAYDWKLPYEPGTPATSMSNPKAVELAMARGAQIQFDDKAKSPYFNYKDEQGGEHVVWFEDGDSIYQKLLLVQEYALGGVSYWTVNQSFPRNWVILNAMYQVELVV